MEFQEIPLSLLHPSPTNPRKTFADLEDLAASIKSQGVMQPILVRPWPDEYGVPEGRSTAPMYEVVAGERRYRASAMAELERIPAMVRELDTRAVLEAQIVENLQRRDVTELEEAEGYQLMMREHSYTADDLAAKVGKSRAYIYGRLKLCELASAPRQAFQEGKIRASVALLIARLPTADMQARACHAIVAGEMSAREAAAHVQASYMQDLNDAKWPLDATWPDSIALGCMPACSGCPSNTSVDRERHADLEPGMCLDTTCFRTKRAGVLGLQADALREQGAVVIAGDEARNLAPHGLGGYIHNGWVTADSLQWVGGVNQSISEHLGDRLQTLPHAWIEDVRSGELVQCIQREVWWAQQRELNLQQVSATQAQRSEADIEAERAQAAQREAEAKHRDAMCETRVRVRDAINEAARHQLMTDRQTMTLALRAVVRWVLDQQMDEAIAGRFFPQLDEQSDDFELDWNVLLDGFDYARLQAVLAFVISTDLSPQQRYVAQRDEMPTALVELAAAYSVDVQAFQAAAFAATGLDVPPCPVAEDAPEMASTPEQAPPGGEVTGAGNAIYTPRVRAPYCHPENPALAWSGRGKKPAWVLEWLEGGGTLEGLCTADQAAPAAANSGEEPQGEAAGAARKAKGKARDSGRAAAGGKVSGVPDASGGETLDLLAGVA